MSDQEAPEGVLAQGVLGSRFRYEADQRSYELQDIRHTFSQGYFVLGSEQLENWSRQDEVAAWPRQPLRRLCLASVNYFDVVGDYIDIHFEGGGVWALHARTELDLLVWVDALKKKVRHTGDLPAKPVILTLHTDPNVASVQLTNMGGDVVFFGTLDPKTKAVETFWSAVVETIGKPKALIGLVLPDGTLVENDALLASLLGMDA